MPFRFKSLAIPGLILIEAQGFVDERGLFLETYQQSAFGANGLSDPFVQDNYSRSRPGVLRGLHYQKHPKAQGKLVMILRGEVFDVAVDIRRGSPTYGQHVGMVLSERDHAMLYIPAGFAHGFCALNGEAEILYKVTVEYAPQYERGIRWNDPDLRIPWPIQDPVVSSRDAALPGLREADNNFAYYGRAAT